MSPHTTVRLTRETLARLERIRHALEADGKRRSLDDAVAHLLATAKESPPKS